MSHRVYLLFTLAPPDILLSCVRNTVDAHQFRLCETHTSRLAGSHTRRRYIAATGYSFVRYMFGVLMQLETVELLFQSSGAERGKCSLAPP